MNRIGALEAQPQLWAPDLDPKRTTHRNHDAQIAIREIKLLRDDMDIAVAPELADVVEPLVDRYQSRPTVGDHLRLPQRTTHDGPQMRAAIRRFLSADFSAPGGSRQAVVAEAKMRRVFAALEYAAQMISRKSVEGANR
jgi:hypothetical protein